MSSVLLAHLICNNFRGTQPSPLHVSTFHSTLKFTHRSMHTWLTVHRLISGIYIQKLAIYSRGWETTAVPAQPASSVICIAGRLSEHLSFTECQWAQPLGLWPTTWPFGWGEINQAINCLQRAIIHPASLLARAPHLLDLSSHLPDVAMIYVSDGFNFKHPQTSTQ